MIEMSETLKKRWPGAVIESLVVRNVRGAGSPPDKSTFGGDLDSLAAGIISDLRGRFAAGGKEALRADPVIAAYDAYYRQFRKTYHVALQLESVIWKGRSIESRNPIVKVMFMAELKNMLLTAVHDLAHVEHPVQAGVGTGSEEYVVMGGETRVVKEGDMMVSDARGVLSSIIYGPDQRTAVAAGSTDLLFCVYAPPGIGEDRVRSHLDDIRRFLGVA